MKALAAIIVLILVSGAIVGPAWLIYWWTKRRSRWDLRIKSGSYGDSGKVVVQLHRHGYDTVTIASVNPLDEEAYFKAVSLAEEAAARMNTAKRSE